MRVLIIKTSSMGDVIHTLPALTDAAKAIPGIQFDWLVEGNFAEIPAWHSQVDQVIPMGLRSWRKRIFSKLTWVEWQRCQSSLKAKKYDFIIDAQGLLKSAWLTRIPKGIRCGLDWSSAREALASIFYQRKFSVNQKQHAVTRMRSLLSQALGYKLDLNSIPDYGIDRNQFDGEENQEKYLVFLHGTTWSTKHWPESYWTELAKIANRHHFKVKLPWGSQTEQARALKIARECSDVEVLSRMKLKEIAKVLARATAIVSVDTGLGHLAAALDVPTISLYGPTDPVLTGAMGQSQIHLSSQFPCSPCFSKDCKFKPNESLYKVTPPCFSTLKPEQVWLSLRNLIFNQQIG